jgi:hypothetical protein
MTSIIKVDNLQNQCGANIINENAGTITIGASGDTVTLAAGASQSGFGRSGSVNWDTTPKTTSPVTAVSGNGYFIDTTSGAITINLPAGTAGDIVAISDYANTAATNNIVISPNGSENIQGANASYEIKVNGGTATLVYVDSTQGWRPTAAATASSITEQALFIAATGGTVTCCGDYKIHTFTGPGTFTVSCAGNSQGSNSVDYLVVAGGGGGGGIMGGGGGAGGFRESVPSPAAWTASPLANPGGALPVTAQGYPITVGAGGPNSGGLIGSNSVFSTITSAGGGGVATCGGVGGSGAGKSRYVGSGSVGNTPPVSPPQGNNGGDVPSSPSVQDNVGGGGGGAGAVGGNASSSLPSVFGGAGGNGLATSITGSSVTYAGGGGGGTRHQPPGITAPSAASGGTGGGGNGGFQATPGVSGGTNLGGGGGGGSYNAPAAGPGLGGNGGSGIVIIRYKFQ